MEKKYIEIEAPYLKIINNKTNIFLVKVKLPVEKKSLLLSKKEHHFYDGSFFSPKTVFASFFNDFKDTIEKTNKGGQYYSYKRIYISSINNYFDIYGYYEKNNPDPNIVSFSLENPLFSAIEDFNGRKKVDLFFEIDDFKKKIENNFVIFNDDKNIDRIYMKINGIISIGYDEYYVNLDLLDLSKSDFLKSRGKQFFQYNPIDGMQSFLLFKESRDFKEYTASIKESLKEISEEFKEADFFKKHFIKNNLEYFRIFEKIKEIKEDENCIIFNEDTVEPYPTYYSNIVSKIKHIDSKLNNLKYLIKNQKDDTINDFKII